MTPEHWEKIKNVLADAMEMSPSERTAYLDQSCGTDPVLRSEIEQLLEHEPHVHSRFLNPTGLAQAAAVMVADEEHRWIGRRVGAYQIVEQIGVGGMGEVYRAFRADDQYQKQVALKVVRTGYDSGSVIARFKNERQILASLEHPNIARLLDGGTTEEGAPFLVMELIEGQPIGEYCDRHTLSITERLNLFVQVCGAVHYAHQHLVIHRDIKPSNILITAEGTPKLLDFGIAKVLGSDLQSPQENTLTAFRALTPEYASPEQINGDSVTTATDVYSLGVVLYHLITGRSPYSATARTSQELVSAICHREPDKPSTLVLREQLGKDGTPPLTPEQVASARNSVPQKLQKQLRGDLDNIVLMALRKEPSRRYGSAERLAEDVQRHLDNLPVMARTDSIRYRASKFVQRHKRGVAVGIAVAAILVVAMAVIVWEAHLARIQRIRAERRFQEVRELANSLIFDVHDSIQEVPGTTAARQLIVSKALHYLDSLEQESQDDLSLQRELAEAYRRIGDVQGNDFSASLGDTGNALSSYQKALTIRRRVLAAQPHNVTDALALAESLRLVSQTHLFAGNLPPALENAREAVSLMEPIAQLHPRDAKVLLEMLGDYQSVANILGGESSLSSLGDNAAALEFRRKELTTAEAYANLDPNDYKAQGNLAIGLSTMGDQLWQDGQIAAPLEHYLRARSIFQGMIAHSARVARATYLLDLVNERLTLVYLAKSDLPSAMHTAQEGLRISQRLTSADPRDIQSGATGIEDSRLVADLESRQGKSGQASLDIDQAIARMQKLVDVNTKDAEMVGIQAALYATAGDIASRSEHYAPALKFYESSIDLLAKVVSANSANAGAAMHLAATYNSLGRVHQRTHKVTAAQTAFHRAVIIAEPMAAANHPDAQALYTIADAYAGMGDTEAALASHLQGTNQSFAHWRQAAAWYTRSLQAWKQIKEPGAISPGGFDCVPHDSVSHRLSQVQRTLANPRVTP